MPDRNRAPHPSPQASLLGRFRSEKKSLPLHPLEKTLLVIVCAHLCFLPWALGTMRSGSQLISLVLAGLGFLCALLPRNYTSDYTNTAPFRLYPGSKLLRFPLFWIGLALLIYIVIQGLNPSWVWERNEKTWWLRKISNIGWLPSSVDTPFERFNLWRQLIIYASSFLLLCTAWIGFTRKKSFQVLFSAIATNALLLAFLGIWQRTTKTRIFPWPLSEWSKEKNFAAFIYQNHAATYLLLLCAVAAALAYWHARRGSERLARSTPAGMWALVALFIGIAVVISNSRGAAIGLVLVGVSSLLIIAINRFRSPSAGTTSPWISIIIAAAVIATVGFGASQLNYKVISKKFDRLVEKGDDENSFQSRLLAYDAARDFWSDYGVRGAGAGGFRFLFPSYVQKHPQIHKNGRRFWEHAHNDWLQIPIELGLVGTALLLSGAGWTIWQFTRRSAWRHPFVMLAITGSGVILILALFDFPLQCPAILATWLFILTGSLRLLEIEPPSGSKARALD
jgi:O-antigen ligase